MSILLSLHNIFTGEKRMTKHRAQHSSAVRPSDILKFDAFVAAVYLPHVKLRKRSWRVDERIAGSICPRHSKRGNLPTYNATK